MGANGKDMVTIAEAAEILGLHHKTVWYHVRKGHLPSTMHGRSRYVILIPRSAVLKFKPALPGNPNLVKK